METGMKWQADSVLLGVLLTACKNYGNIEITEGVAQEIIKQEPDNLWVYVLSIQYICGGGEMARCSEVEESDEGLDGVVWKVIGS